MVCALACSGQVEAAVFPFCCGFSSPACLLHGGLDLTVHSSACAV